VPSCPSDRTLIIEGPLNGGLQEPLSELVAAVEAMKTVPWTTLQELKGDETVLKKLDEVESLLQSLRKALKSE